jgi:hypothetical protein
MDKEELKQILEGILIWVLDDFIVPFAFVKIAFETDKPRKTWHYFRLRYIDKKLVKWQEITKEEFKQLSKSLRVLTSISKEDKDRILHSPRDFESRDDETSEENGFENSAISDEQDMGFS